MNDLGTSPITGTSNAYDRAEFLPGRFTLNSVSAPDATLFGGVVKNVQRFDSVGANITFRVTLQHNVLIGDTHTVGIYSVKVPAEQDYRVVMGEANIAGQTKDPVTQLDFIVRDDAGVDVDTVATEVHFMLVRND